MTDGTSTVALPPRDAEPATLLTVAPRFVSGRPREYLQDAISSFDPDAVLLAGTDDVGARAELRRIADVPVLSPDARLGEDVTVHRIGDVEIAVLPRADALDELAEPEAGRRTPAYDPDSATFVASDLLAVEVRPSELATVLRGAEEYRRGLEGCEGTYVHLSTAIEGGYRHRWEDLVVYGGGKDAGVRGTPLCGLELWPDGTVLTRTVSPDRFGLRALDRVGPRTAKRLREQGYRTREAVADATASELRSVEGVGRRTAETILRSARAFVDGRVVRTDGEPLPDGEPVFVDVETDGVSPSVAWLVGVLDGDRYMSFLQKDPLEEGTAVELFVDWYAANASHRPLVAYNGWRFDFPVIRDHLAEHSPSSLDAWSGSYRFDPLQWAVEDGHALLPGRTNRLDDVAGALGWEPRTAGVDGAVVARTYRRWKAYVDRREGDVDLDGSAAPDWDRLTRYNEDDLRALATVYDALRDADRLGGDAGRTPDVEETTTQGTLSEW